MKELILQILGYDSSQIPENATWNFVWTAAESLESWRVFVFIGLLIALVWAIMHFYRRENDVSPKPVRVFLGVVRIMVILLLAAVFLSPAIQISENKTRHATVLVLVDDSLSMLTKDKYLDDATVSYVAEMSGKSADAIRSQEPDRIELIKMILDSNGNKLVRDLSRKGNVKVMTFANKVGSVQVFPFASVDAVSTAGDTDQAAQRVADGEATKRIILTVLGGIIIALIVSLFVLRAARGKGDAQGANGGGRFFAHGYVVLLLGITAWAATCVVLDINFGQKKEVPKKETDDKPDVIDYAVTLNANGQGTNLGRAVRDAIKSVPGSPIAAIVLISDGQNTARDEDPLAAAEFAGDQTVPIFAMGVGDPSRRVNLRVTQASANENVRKDNPFQIEGEIEAQGLEAGTYEVELVATKMPGGGTGENRLDSKRIEIPASIEGADGSNASVVRPVNFEFTPKQPGKYEFAIRVQAMPNEADPDDNLSKPIPVTVRSDKTRVLLVSGGPTWEYRQIVGVLQRAEDINLSCWLQSMESDMRQDGNTVIDHLPNTPKELFDYDAVIMLDPNPREFNEIWIENLRTYIGEHGGGFLYMPGPKFATTFLGGIRTQGLKDLLPVKFGDIAALDVRELISSHTKEWPLHLVPANLDHPIMAFDPGDRPLNTAVWSAMPGIYWSFPAQAAKPATRVLVEHSNPGYNSGREKRPLLVAGQYGPGKIVYLGLNGTWRWKRLGANAEFFEKFWVQGVNFLIQGRDQRGSKRGYLDVAGTTFNVGDRIEVSAKLYDPSYFPMEDPTVEAILKTERGLSEVTLERVGPESPGIYKAVIAATQLGSHSLTVQLPTANPRNPAKPITRSFEVVLPRVETEVTRLNKQLLSTMAEYSGGKYFEVNQWQDIPVTVPDRSRTIVVPQKPKELWSTDRLLILLIILLTIEWAYRKRFKLM